MIFFIVVKRLTNVFIVYLSGGQVTMCCCASELRSTVQQLALSADIADRVTVSMVTEECKSLCTRVSRASCIIFRLFTSLILLQVFQNNKRK